MFFSFVMYKLSLSISMIINNFLNGRTVRKLQLSPVDRLINDIKKTEECPYLYNALDILLY